MATNSFTPGPWAVQSIGLEDDCDYDIVREGGEDEGTARVVMTVAGDRPNAEANAALVASAPELYEVLAAIVERLDGDRDFICPDGGAEMIVAARAALAKAEGK